MENPSSSSGTIIGLRSSKQIQKLLTFLELHLGEFPDSKRKEHPQVETEKSITWLLRDFLDGKNHRPFRFSIDEPEDFEDGNSPSVDISIGQGVKGSHFSKTI